jgi:hypothetical protein
MPTLWKETKDAIQTLIPELAENEDERMRKEAISIVQSYMNICDEEGDPCLPGYEVLAWLEKQKEQKTLSTEETELNSLAFLEQMGYTCIPPGKEQKPAEQSEKDEIIERIKSVIEKYLPGREKQLNTSYIEFGMLFSGEWEVYDYVYDVIQDTSEDSKEKLERIRKYLRAVKDNLTESRITNEWTPRKTGMSYAVGDIEAAFKEIQDKKEQKPAERSESEKSHQWKPSEEQMDALNEVINTLAASKHPHENDYLFNVLNGLRENLKEK